ncbi:MAG: hypothetical protein JNJ61_16555 [Anaerolineae bacterium]|nr:hypothetical protein [Anaerolineae bacterium]
MDRISAAGNLTIEIDAELWRLLLTNNTRETVLLEAAPNQPLRYIELFGSKRVLPSTGALPLHTVQRVVVGWSADDDSWHLGLLLGPEIAQPRGSRWCELARWPDADQTVFGDLAAQAGRGLARVLACPFNLIEPQQQTAAKVTTIKPRAAAQPLPELPLQLNHWTLDRRSALQFTRAAQWSRARIIRIIWYVLLIAVYLALSVATLRGTIALPRPEFLPYLGLVTAVLLVGFIIYTLYQLLSAPNRIVVDNQISAMRGNNVRWAYAGQDVQAVYASEIVNRNGKKRSIYHGELNLYLNDGTFRRLLDVPHMVFNDQVRDIDNHLQEELVTTLTADTTSSDLQAAGLYVAQALGVECRYDLRLK